MKSYELFLDESGSFFENEENLKKNPSLVGGVLMRKGAIGKEDVLKKVLKRESVHMCEMIEEENIGEYAVGVLERIKQIPAYFVIFENNERLRLSNDKELYLNIISEGILNLAEKISLEKSDESIELDVLIATRVDLESENNKKIEKERYDQMILEKIYLKMAEKNLFLSKNFKINISFGKRQ